MDDHSELDPFLQIELGETMNKETQAKEKPKKTYATPRLINYGAVRLLIQAGISGSAEGSSGMNPNMA